MDEIQMIEVKALFHQTGMNEVIDRGDSAVQQFYCGSTVFVTGSSGFLGKQLVEKLIRSCDIKKMYVLLRSKKNKTIKERLEYVLSDPLYTALLSKQPDFAKKIVPVEGDVAEIRLGLSDADWTLLTQEVDTVFHMAATVRFNEPLKAATRTNVRGTRETLTLAKECTNLKNFVYVSTAYTHATKGRVGKPVLEQFYPCPVTPEVMISLTETLDETKLKNITEKLIEGWPNTYTFTKAIAEELVRTTPGIPSCVIRPPIVCCSYYEPHPGWLDRSALSGPAGILAGAILGIVHVFYVGKDCKIPMTPVDYVNNATIAAGWDAARRKDNGEEGTPIYTITNKNYFVSWETFAGVLRNSAHLTTPKAVWYCYLIEVRKKYLYKILSFFLHYIPAYLMDAVGAVTGKTPKSITSIVGVFRMIDTFAEIYYYFLSNEWGFVDDNVQAMISNMSDADKDIYNCDMKTIDFNEYILIWAMGIRKYIFKDGLINSKLAYKKQQLYKMANYILISFYVFIVWSILNKCWSIVNQLF